MPFKSRGQVNTNTSNNQTEINYKEGNYKAGHDSLSGTSQAALAGKLFDDAVKKRNALAVASE